MRHRPLLLLLLAALLAACDARLQRLELTLLPAAPLPRGLSAQLVAVGHYSDGTQRDLTSQAVFATTDANVAVLSDAPGARSLVRAVAPGQVQLTARSGGVSAATTLTVSDAVVRSLALSPAVAAIARGTTQAFKATATLSDGSTREVADLQLQADAAVAEARGATLRGVARGLTTVTATLADQRATATLVVSDAALVSLALSPETLSLPVGVPGQLQALGTFSDGTVQDLSSLATWQSDDDAVAAARPAGAGTILSVTPGRIAIHATALGQSARAEVTISDARISALVLTPESTVLARGQQARVQVQATYSDGSVRDVSEAARLALDPEGVATVASVSGLVTVTAVDLGRAVLSAHVADLKAEASIVVTAPALLSIAVSPQAPTVTLGQTQTFVATGTFSDGTSTDLSSLVLWQSSDEAVAALLNRPGVYGTIDGQREGSATLSASYAGLGDATTLTVFHPLPVPGAVTLAAQSSTSLLLTFTAAQGGLGALDYAVYLREGAFSDASISTITSEGTLVAGSARPGARSLDGLRRGATYSAAVLVSDAAGGRALYPLRSAATVGYKVLYTVPTASGALGGVAGADALCQAGRPAGVAAVKAVLSDGVQRVACATPSCAGGAAEHVDWALQPTTPYGRTDGTLVATTAGVGIFAFPLNAGLSPGEDLFTGLNSLWQQANSCTGWTVPVGTGQMGLSSAVDSRFLSATPGACSGSGAVLCAEQ